MSLSELNNTLKTICINDPIKSLLSPDLIFKEYDGNVRLCVKINTVNAVTSKNIEGFEANFNITPYLVGRYTRKPKDLADFVRRCLLEFCKHEIDESLTIDNKLVFPPQHWGPSEEEMDLIRKEINDERR